jgi:hypothetical protein
MAMTTTPVRQANTPQARFRTQAPPGGFFQETLERSQQLSSSGLNMEQSLGEERTRGQVTKQKWSHVQGTGGSCL